MKTSRNNTGDSGYLKSHELESWQKHSSRSAQKNPENFLPNQNDQAYLISTAAGPEHRENSVSSLRSESPASTTAKEGISKNITVSQVFEVVR